MRFFFVSLLWYLILILGTMGCPDLSSLALWCFKGSMDNYIVKSLNESTSLLKSDCFIASRPTIFYTSGYGSNVTTTYVTDVINAYIWRNEYNVIYLDCHKLVAVQSNEPSDSDFRHYAGPNGKCIGEAFSDTILRWIKNGLQLSTCHLVGMSLGAHILGAAGQRAQQIGFIFPRITGLDPPHDSYEPYAIFGYRLQADSAKVVDIIHTNPGEHGISKSFGTIDIWFNYKHYDQQLIQPGCPVGNYSKFTTEGVCSHGRSMMYWSEAVYHADSFVASGAPSYEKWYCYTPGERLNNVIRIGENTNLMATGNYYLTTNANIPYGKGVSGLFPHSKRFG